MEKLLSPAVLLVTLSFIPLSADASCNGARQEFREGVQELAKERREMLRKLQRSDSRPEARREIHEGVREKRREKQEMRREIRRELRPWCALHPAPSFYSRGDAVHELLSGFGKRLKRINSCRAC